MTAASGGLHEPAGSLPSELLDRHRAIVSVIEELEAIDWDDQRVAATTDPELAAILAHNRDEEKEHAAMVLEWLRRHDPALDAELRSALFSQGPVLGAEARAPGAPARPDPGDGLGLGDLGRTNGRA